MVEPARTPRGRIRSAAAVALIAVCAAFAGLACQSPASASSSVSPPAVALRTEAPGVPGKAAVVVPDGTAAARGGARRAVGTADGVLPAGTTVFDGAYPGIANLDPGLLGALRRATADAAREGTRIFVTSGWRSASYQEQLFRQAISTYGSPEKAAQWVATPGTSAHESGEAVDIARSDAAAWLSRHGAAYGLCQVYGNEPWHYELRSAAADQGCPPMYTDPTHDPRTQP